MNNFIHEIKSTLERALHQIIHSTQSAFVKVGKATLGLTKKLLNENQIDQDALELGIAEKRQNHQNYLPQNKNYLNINFSMHLECSRMHSLSLLNPETSNPWHHKSQINGSPQQISKMPVLTQDVVKIAVKTNLIPDAIPQLIEFDQTQPLTTIIQNLCNRWSIV
uniref:CSON000165 protein n=1 Tax=Culicoides sonorensis TaxID=179676 RepID=A0A336LQ37_CULSO